MSYWTKRLEQIANKNYDDSVKIMKDLKRMYLQALDELEAAYEELYIRMLEDGEVSPLTQYKFNRYQKLEREFVEQLKKLGQEEVRMLEDLAISAYVAVATETSGVLNYVFEPLQLHQMAQKAFEMNWKGSNFSSRIWNNKNKLLVRLKKMVTDTIALGKSKDETVKDFMKAFNASFSDADRLVRTELMNIINQAQKDIYTQRGYRKYTLLPHYDNRTSEICKSLNTTKEYEFKNAITGENYPPLHPRCRTITIPVITSMVNGDIITLDDETYNKLSTTAKEINFRGEILKRFKLPNLATYDFDEKHIQEERNHGVTKEEAQSFIVTARFVVSRWKGKSLMYISEDGVAIVNDDTTVATSYKKREFDPKIKELLRVIKDE